jgi:hypothetical protein
MHGAGSCRLAFGPEQGGACENDHGRERSDSAEQGFSSQATREVSTGAKSSTGSERPLHDVPRHGASVNTRSIEAVALYGASSESESRSANSRGPCAATHRATELPHHVYRVTHGIDVA